MIIYVYVDFIIAILFWLVCAFFGEPSYEVNEIEGPLEFSLKLDKPAEEDSFILVGGYPFGAAPAAPGELWSDVQIVNK